MNNEDALRLDRYARIVEDLGAWRNEAEADIEAWSFASDGSGGRELRIGDFWPESPAEDPVRLSARVEIPSEWAGRNVEMELWLGGEGFVEVSSDGNPASSGGLNPFHRTFRVAEKARGGERVSVEAEVVPRGLFGSRIAEPRLEHAKLVVPESGVRDLVRDLAVICDICAENPDHDSTPRLLDIVDTALSMVFSAWPSGNDATLDRLVSGYGDSLGSGLASLPPGIAAHVPGASRRGALWSLPRSSGLAPPLPEEARRKVAEARVFVSEALEGVKAEHPPSGRVALTGHAHLDLAWLWPLAETRRKARRTFASVLGLMDRYDDFVFNQSSAQLYRWLEDDDPEMFERVRERISEGRWEAVGGSWTEPDCQIPSGESFVRQLLYGQKYFESRFGRRSSVAWLPDVFGFSPSLPQLLRGAGIEGFFTAKLKWGETNEFPHDLFLWEGLDGTRIKAHTFRNPGMDYNGNVSPRDILGTWRNFVGKRNHPESLFSVGWGDGGGGPSVEMLENYARMKDFPATPRLRMSRVDDFFATLPDEDLPTWVGELYLELHRGTLTSQAKVKSLNRRAEHRLMEAEAFGELARLHGEPPTDEGLGEVWKTLLLNQFHDILPGSSIAEVYIEAHAQLERVCEAATEARDASLARLASRVRTPSGARSFLVANAALRPRPLSVVLPGNTPVTDHAGNPVPTQTVEDGTLVHDPDRIVPPLGYATLAVGEGVSGGGGTNTVSAGWDGDAVLVENSLLRVVVGSEGSLGGVWDKEEKREVFEGRGNRLWAYVDKPREWDAWDIDARYEKWGEEVGGVVSVEVVEAGPLRASVRVEREWRDSRITQTYRMLAGSRRVDIETNVEWEERQILLRALFPLRVHAHEATFETMYGAVSRPTHRNTSWDAARFEVSGHRFVDMSETGYGVAILNDGKYGHSAHGNTLGVSLLRSPAYPDLLADRGKHEFTYSVFPHTGDWTEAGVSGEALAINSPLFASEATPSGEPALPNEMSFVEVGGTPLSLGAVKPPEDGGESVIVRVYEPHGARGESILAFPRDVAAAERMNLLEDPDTTRTPPTVNGNTIRLRVRPFEVATLRVSFVGGG